MKELYYLNERGEFTLLPNGTRVYFAESFYFRGWAFMPMIQDNSEWSWLYEKITNVATDESYYFRYKDESRIGLCYIYNDGGLTLMEG